MANKEVFYFVLLACFMLLCSASTKDDACCNLNTVRVIGNGQVQIVPDTATIYAYITQDGTTATQALTNVNTILTAVMASLQADGVSKQNVATSYISVYPKYDYSNGTAVINGYTVYLSLTITIPGINLDNTKVANVIDGIAKAGVSSISGITYTNSNPDLAESLARKLAFSDASNKAKQYAQLAGRKLNRIILIDETNQAYSPYGVSTSSILRVTPNTQQPNVAIPPGKTTVAVRVIIVWLFF